MRYPNGLFGWVDLMTRDTATATQFYEGLFGWTHVDQPTPMGPPYTQFFKDAKLVAGMSPMMPGVPDEIGAFWNSYVIVEDADATVEKAQAAGGTVTMPPMDVMDQGRMAMLTDPSGAAFGLWQPGSHQGADVFNVPGSLTWNELQTRDLAAAMPFYEQVFGWEWTDGTAGHKAGYKVAHLPGKPGDDQTNAGAEDMPRNVPEEIPAVWQVYFAVTDAQATVTTALDLGGKVFVAPHETATSVVAGILDPNGGRFYVVSER